MGLWGHSISFYVEQTVRPETLRFLRQPPKWSRLEDRFLPVCTTHGRHQTTGQDRGEYRMQIIRVKNKPTTKNHSSVVICVFEWCSCRENHRVTGKTRGTGSPNTVTLINPAHWASFDCAHPAAPGVHSNTFQITALVWLVHSRQATKQNKQQLGRLYIFRSPGAGTTRNR